MGETPAKVTKAMGETRARIEASVASLKINTAATADDASQRIALAAQTLGATASETVGAAAASVPKLVNPMPLLVAFSLLGFAVGSIVPLTAIERDRLRPLGDEIVRQAKAARANLLGAI